MLLDVAVPPEGLVRKTFTVNVRRGIEGDALLDTDGRLNLEFIGSNPSLMKLDIKPNEKAITVFIVGDSIACDQDLTASAGGLGADAADPIQIRRSGGIESSDTQIQCKIVYR